MTLNHYAAQHRMAIYEALQRGSDPPVGKFDSSTLREARTKGAPQMGTTQYTPAGIVFEFIFPDPRSTAIVLPIELDSPERIVFLPVPTWVVENIWQGDIAGTYHFESEANRLIEEFQFELTPEGNRKWFGPQAAKRRE